MNFWLKYDAVIGWMVAATWAPSDLPGGRWTEVALVAVAVINAVLSYLRIRRLSNGAQTEQKTAQ